LQYSIGTFIKYDSKNIMAKFKVRELRKIDNFRLYEGCELYEHYVGNEEIQTYKIHNSNIFTPLNYERTKPT